MPNNGGGNMPANGTYMPPNGTAYGGTPMNGNNRYGFNGVPESTPNLPYN